MATENGFFSNQTQFQQDPNVSQRENLKGFYGTAVRPAYIEDLVAKAEEAAANSKTFSEQSKQYRDEAEVIRDETQVINDQTDQVYLDTVQVYNDAVTDTTNIYNNTVGVYNDTVTVYNDTVSARDLALQYRDQALGHANSAATSASEAATSAANAEQAYQDTLAVVPDLQSQINERVTYPELTEAQNDIVGGSIFKGSNGETVEVGDELPINTTHIRISVGGDELLVSAWGDLTLPATVTAVPTTDNGFGGYNLVTNQGTFEFVTEDKQSLREENDILGWFTGDVFDGVTDITSNILAAKTYVEGTNSRNIICSKGNAFINGIIELDNEVDVSFGNNKVIAGPSMQWIVRKGSNVVINDVRLGEDGKTQNLQPLFLVNSEAGPIFLDGQRDTSIVCGVKSEIETGAPFVRLEAKVKSGQDGSSAVTGVDVDIKTNQGRRAVEINADNLADTSKRAFVNSCRINLKASATNNGIYEIYNSDESIIDKPVNCEIAQNHYFIEYQAAPGRFQVPLNSIGDRHVIDGSIWDLHVASNMSNVRVRGDGCNILSSSFPTEESGRLVVGNGITPNALGGLGGTQRSRAYSHIAHRTHCKYLGTGRTTNDLINATYAFLVSATDAIISGTDYSDGTIINSKTFPPSQFILNGDISVDYKMIGKPTVGDKFGLGIRINGTTYSTLRASGLTSDGFIAYLTLYMSVNDNRVDIAYKVGGNEKILVSQSVPDLSVNGATIEVYGFSHEGSEPSNRVTIAGLDGLIKYKTA